MIRVGHSSTILDVTSIPRIGVLIAGDEVQKHNSLLHSFFEDEVQKHNTMLYSLKRKYRSTTPCYKSLLVAYKQTLVVVCLPL